MDISQEANERIQYHGDNKKKKKLPLIIIGSAILLGGIACAIALPLVYCSSRNVYTIKTDGSDQYFGFVDNNTTTPGDINQLSGWKTGGSMGDSDREFYSQKYTELIIPAGVTSIRDSAFYGCTSFRDNTHPIKVDFNLQSSFTSIGASAFDGCAGITVVDFSGCEKDALITSIGESAFAGCRLTNIIPGSQLTELSLNHWGEDLHVFVRVDSGFVPDFTDDSGDKDLYCTDCGCLVYGTFAPTSSATKISSGAFCGCAGVTAVDFSKNNENFTSIGANAFDGCALQTIVAGHGIERISLPEWGNNFYVFRVQSDSPYIPNYSTNHLYNSGCGCLVYGTFAPTGGTFIGAQAFWGCGGITAVDFSNFVLPNQTYSIGVQAFYHCSGIRSYTFSSKQLYDEPFSVGSFAFAGCAVLGKVISDSIDVAVELLAHMVVSSPSWMSAEFWTTSTK